MQIPVSLDDAGGLSSIQIQVNFDPGLLTLQSVARGALGSTFEEMISEVNDGTLAITFASAENVASGGGALAIMTFLMAKGAETTLYSEISLADYAFGDSSGVVAIDRKESLTSSGGRVSATQDRAIDNFGNGLPDWWEETYSLSLFSVSGWDDDIDFDGIVHLLEYALVTDPTRPSVLDDLTFSVRDDDPDLTYYVSVSDDLALWDDWLVSFDGASWSIDAASGVQVSAAVDQGDDTWVLGLQWTAEANPRGFMQFKATR